MAVEKGVAKPANRLTREILARIYDWQGYAEDYLNEAVLAEERIDGIVQRKREGMGFANVNDLELLNIHEANVSAVESVLLGDNPPFMFTASTLEAARMQKAAASQAVMARNWAIASVEIALNEILHDWSLHGTGIGEVGWSFSLRNQGDRRVDPATGKVSEGITPVPYRDFATLKPVALWNFAFELGAWEDLNDAEWVCEERHLTERQIRALIAWAKTKPSALVQEFEKLQIPKGTPSTFSDDFEERRTSSFGVGSTPRRPFKCRFFKGLHPIDKKKQADYLIVLVNDADWAIQVVNPHDHGLKGYVMSTFRRKKGHPYGRGIWHILKDPHDEMNEIGNLVTDVSSFALAGAWLSKGIPLQQATINIGPGDVVNKADFGGELEQLFPRIEILPPALSIQDRLRVSMRTAGAAASTQQALPSGSDLASEVKLMAAEAGRRIVGLAKRPADQIVRPFLWMAHGLNRQYLSRKVLGKLADKDVEWGKDDLVPDPELELKLASDFDNRTGLLRRISTIFTPLLTAAEKSPRLARYVEPVLLRMLSLSGVPTASLPDSAAPDAAAPADPLAAVLAAAGGGPAAGAPGPAAPATPAAGSPVVAPAGPGAGVPAAPPAPAPVLTPGAVAAVRRRDTRGR